MKRTIAEVRARVMAGAPLSIDDLAVWWGCCTKTVRRRMKEGRFPEPDIRINLRVVRWSAELVRPHLRIGEGAGGSLIVPKAADHGSKGPHVDTELGGG